MRTLWPTLTKIFHRFTMEYQWSSSHGAPWRIHGQCHKKIHGNTMDFSWSILWIYHGYLIIDHGFVISTMKNAWTCHGLSMYFPWSIDGISSWFFEYGHRKTWVFHGSDHGFPWNNHGFPMSLPCYFLWMFHFFPMGLLWTCSCGF